MGRDPDTRLDEVRALAARGDHGEALHGYRELCESDPYDPDLWLERAGVAEAAGLVADAVEALLHVLALYADTGMAEAIDVAERVLELDPADRRARDFLASHAPDRKPRSVPDAGDGAAAGATGPGPGSADPVPEPIWDTVPMTVPSAASLSLPVALPILDSVP
ncbi:MAG TPA: tetratricopeptide repeat protein, partial [Haliangium sp.]|nr:tetratricopeptide repeat protein [Haliangium sp.]